MEQEKELVRKAQEDPQAFGVIFDLYYERVYAYSLKRTGDASLAEDITAATFHKALSALWRFVWRDISLSSWIYKIATNEIRKHYRFAAKNVSMDEEYDLVADLKDELLDDEDTREREGRVLLTRNALRRLPFRYQNVLYLRFVEGKKIAEISEILGKREGTVKSLISRGVKILKKEVAESSAQPNGRSRIIENEG